MNIHHVGQFVQYLIDLLAVREANVGLPHQTPHFLPDVIFVQLNKQKQEKKGSNTWRDKNINNCLTVNIK